ncbi:cryptochrome/photolyase family protein [Endozoicomonas euniceicola]|uniref:Cryptochrome/photolyase family protein n=1 Tax=Endozoicomonas euniceicola TaxID=1234143 RepID=A0ABY6GUM0_9GAMM|nr:cryptochrome/photolyase family protein [Endozoicomonas euniceicola]UYM16477.1 cryptochrome/photolyase family protein [Endozoicomonas euniceicola]
MKSKYTRLRLILGDQLNIAHGWYTRIDPDCLYFIAELEQEARYVKHHVQKLCGFFLAMDNFARPLREAGHQVIHFTLDETAGFRNLSQFINRVAEVFLLLLPAFGQFQDAMTENSPHQWSLTENSARSEDGRKSNFQTNLLPPQ